jgi:hypothetical protein
MNLYLIHRDRAMESMFPLARVVVEGHPFGSVIFVPPVSDLDQRMRLDLQLAVQLQESVHGFKDQVGMALVSLALIM